MNAYRFKTKQEFEDVYGADWREEVDFYFGSEMDKFFGQKFTNEENLQVWDELLEQEEEEGYSEDLSSIDDLRIRGYSISGDMLKQEGTFIPTITTRYRFRTKAEFEKEYGEDWREELRNYFDTSQDHLLGRVLSIEENLLVQRCMDRSQDYFFIGEEEIYLDMLVEISGCCIDASTSLNPTLFKRRPRIRVNQES